MNRCVARRQERRSHPVDPRSEPPPRVVSATAITFPVRSIRTVIRFPPGTSRTATTNRPGWRHANLRPTFHPSLTRTGARRPCVDGFRAARVRLHWNANRESMPVIQAYTAMPLVLAGPPRLHTTATVFWSGTLWNGRALAAAQRVASLSPRISTLKNPARWTHARASTVAGAVVPVGMAASAPAVMKKGRRCLKEVEDR
jgi:hypothetical protein